MQNNAWNWCVCEKIYVYCILDFLHNAVVNKYSNAQIPVNGREFCFKWLTLPQLRKLIFSLTLSSFLPLQLPFKLLAAIRSRSCYCSTPSDLLTCGPITTSDAVPVWLFSSYFCRFCQNFVTFIVFTLQGLHPPNFCLISVSLRGLYVCFLSNWRQWISIDPFYTFCTLWVHLGSAHGQGIYLGIEPHCSLLELSSTDRLCEQLFSEEEEGFFRLLTATLLSLYGEMGWILCNSLSVKTPILCLE